MTSLKQQIEKNPYLAKQVHPEAKVVLLKDVLGLLADYVCIPTKQLEELREKYGNEPYVKRTSAFKAISQLLEESK
ncbi:MAG: hypothetical protein E3J87_07125 [Candidatus Cloacimonadota bacterium]|nr:MAG: hypothetical protein E3J87_07125 [Candidatus Cloacimonadota bacterium]